MIRPFVLLLLFPLLIHAKTVSAQLKLYEGTFNGGVVTGGYSNGATIPSGSGSFNVNIPAGSAILQAYLIAGRLGNAPDVTVTLNGTPHTFSAANNITSGFTSLYGGPSGVHAIDVTSTLSAATASYTIAVPAQNTVSDKYPEFYLYIAFQNAGLPAASSAIFLNTGTLNQSILNWTLATSSPVTNTSPVGFAILGGYAAPGADCENVTVNGTNIGSFTGQDFNASSQWGAMAGFQYYNNTLTGYNDDNANQAISGPDVLSNIQAVIPNNISSIPVTFTHCGGGSDNHVWATFLTWSGGVILDETIRLFEAERNGFQADLSWEMLGEGKIAGFEVQRSQGESGFQTIGSVTASGNLGNTRYDWTDSSPKVGENRYRLRVVDHEGMAVFTESKSIFFEAVPKLIAACYPIPLGQGNGLNVDLTEHVDFHWVVYGLDGRVMNAGEHAGAWTAELPLEELSAGAYLLLITTETKSEFMKFSVE